MALSDFGRSITIIGADFKPKNLYEYLLVFARETMDQIRKNLDKSDSNATGNLRQSLKPVEVKILGNIYRLRYSFPDYALYVDKGRGKTKRVGKMHVRKGVYKWIAAKGIPVRRIAEERVRKLKKRRSVTNEDIEDVRQGIAFVIANKIHRKGFKGNQFISKVLNQRAYAEMKRNIAKKLKEDIRIEVTKGF